MQEDRYIRDQVRIGMRCFEYSTGYGSYRDDGSSVGIYAEHSMEER